MAKAWLYKRPRGFDVLWREANRLRSRRFTTRHDADEFRIEKECELSDDRPGRVDLPWLALRNRYLAYARTASCEPETLRQYENTLATFHRLQGPLSSSQFQHSSIEGFVANRRAEDTAAATINKDLRHLKAFVRWAVEERLMGPAAQDIRWRRLWQTETRREPRAVSLDEFGRILRAAGELYGTSWLLRIILSVTTGVRQQDIDRLRIEDVHPETATLSVLNRKAHKLKDRPLHALAAMMLARYIDRLPAGQIRLWPDRYHRSKWERIKAAAGITDRLTYHNLRHSCASFIMQAGYSTGVAQELLDHATPYLTQRVYASLSPVYREAVNSIPLAQAVAGCLTAGEAPADAGSSVASPGCRPGDTAPAGPSCTRPGPGARTAIDATSQGSTPASPPPAPQ
jgi:site-specific recombinase XerD